jgi:hypothetical protein
MEPTMRRLLVLALPLVLAIGCKHVAGKCDCQSHPADGAPHAITNPYPSAPVLGPATLPPAKGN